jgi:hypothetical protein
VPGKTASGAKPDTFLSPCFAEALTGAENVQMKSEKPKIARSTIAPGNTVVNRFLFIIRSPYFIDHDSIKLSFVLTAKVYQL